MVIKKYVVNDMQEAIENARRELGSDAVILSTKEVKKKGLKFLFSKPQYEVVVAYDAKGDIAINNQPGQPKKNPPSAKGPLGKKGGFNRSDSVLLSNDIALLDNKISNIDKTISSFINRMETNYNDKYASYSKEIRAIAGKLIENEVNEDTIYKLCDAMSQYVLKTNCDESEAINTVLAKFLGKENPIVTKKNGPTVVMFVGATGVGKTTTLSKLATEFKVKNNSDIAIITTDTYKIASAEQLKVYSDILNIPLSIVYSMDEFNTEFAKYQEKDLIFIDTGLCPDEDVYKDGIQDVVSIAKPDYLYLVVSANTTYKSCKKILNNYNYIKGFRYIITKMDEALSCGTVFNLKSLSNRPISYLTWGQVLTNDIKEYNWQDIVDILMG